MTKTLAVILTPSNGSKDRPYSYSDTALLCLCQFRMVHRLGLQFPSHATPFSLPGMCMRGKNPPSQTCECDSPYFLYSQIYFVSGYQDGFCLVDVVRPAGHLTLVGVSTGSLCNFHLHFRQENLTAFLVEISFRVAYFPLKNLGVLANVFSQDLEMVRA